MHCSFPEFKYLKVGRALVYAVFYVMLKIKVRNLTHATNSH